MKLILCERCTDVVRLKKHTKTCECGDSGGRYVNELDAEIWGPCVPLGFANSTLRDALAERPDEGMGSRFVAFVIPRSCPTVVHRDSRGAVRDAALDRLVAITEELGLYEHQHEETR